MAMRIKALKGLMRKLLDYPEEELRNKLDDVSRMVAIFRLQIQDKLFGIQIMDTTIQLEPKEFDFLELTRLLLITCSILFERKDVQLRLKTTMNFPSKMHGDRAKVKVLLFSLL